MTIQKQNERKERAAILIRTLKKIFPHTGISLVYKTHWELLVAVILSAQCTDKKVNEVTARLFKKYPTFTSYLRANKKEFERDIRQTGFYHNKAKNILAAAQLIHKKFNNKIPKTMSEMLLIPGVARKTANVVLGNAYGIIEGIAVDTHVKRFAQKFELTDYTDPVRIEKDLMLVIPKKEWLVFTYLAIAYGRNICPARKHKCATHPLSELYPKAAHIWPKP